MLPKYKMQKQDTIYKYSISCSCSLVTKNVQKIWRNSTKYNSRQR